MCGHDWIAGPAGTVNMFTPDNNNVLVSNRSIIYHVLGFTPDTSVSRGDAEDEGEKTLEEDQSRSQREV